jgi:TfoX/Sxy family transcriptional regulator of competence genes
VAYDVHLADRIRSILNGAAQFSEKKMFGGLTFMVNGRMCCGVLKDDLVLRLTPEKAVAALRQPHTRPMDFTGSPMKSMIYVSPIGTDSDEALAAWVESAVRVAQSVPERKSATGSGGARRSTSAASAARRSASSNSASRRPPPARH